MFIIGGIVGSGVFGAFVEIKRKYKLAIIVICILSFASTFGMMFGLISKSIALTTIFCFIVGFSMIPIMVVGFELGVECTYPIGEAMSTGVMMSATQVVGIIFVRIQFSNYS